MSQMLPWTLLNILVWGVGVKAVRDLRSQFDPQAKTWFFLDWGVRSCLVMEITMLGMGYARCLALLSVATGIASAALMWLGFRSLQNDICSGKTLLLGRLGLRLMSEWILLAGGVLCLLGGWAFPRAVDLMVGALQPVEGAAWLVVSAWLGLRLSMGACPSREARVFRPAHFSLSFAFSFLHAALTPFSRLTALAVPPGAAALLGTLFVLTLVWALASLVVRVHASKALEAQNELHALNERLFGIEKLVAVGTLAAGAAHDFNNVLAAIIGVAELGLKDRGLTESTRQDFEDIRSSARSAAAVSSRLMGVARLGAVNAQQTNLMEAVELPLGLLGKEFARHRIQVVKRIEAVPPIAGDLGQVTQVCLNLFLNARDAMIPNGGVLEVSLASKDGWIELAVSDTGTGIPKEFQPKMFQALQTTKGEKGTGLGLSASRSVVAAMGGDISYETQEGRGTAFRVRFPVPETASEGLDPDRPPATVLIVDDDEIVRRTLMRMTQALGRKAVSAENGEEALRTLSADRAIGLVISDVQMPVMNGIELLGRVLSDFKQVRALMMTGSSAAGLDLPAGPQVLGLLQKPVSLEDLRRYLV